MFPSFRAQLLAGADLLVELSTLGGYGVGERGGLVRLDPERPDLARGSTAETDLERRAERSLPRTRGRCAEAGGSRACATARGRGARARP